MAGSAGSPPPVLTVYVCPECPAATAYSLCDHERENPRPRRVPVEYVPREQSDALLRQADRVVSLYFEFETLDDQTLAHALSEDMDTLHRLVEAYREATAGEDGDG